MASRSRFISVSGHQASQGKPRPRRFSDHRQITSELSNDNEREYRSPFGDPGTWDMSARLIPLVAESTNFSPLPAATGYEGQAEPQQEE